MTNQPPFEGAISRRSLGKWAGGGLLAIATGGAASAAHGFTAGRPPVVGFHADAPWYDPSGRDTPYLPPRANGRFAPDTESLMRLGFFL
ncbi:hypothetical protein [Sphingobium amiense]|uniref:hypothetical protein n=1 Tax=Sphingobium amiense TaxID=135719 RepID=UPI0008310DB9|nr:hypothetical protein [Sphingobium amiense]